MTLSEGASTRNALGAWAARFTFVLFALAVAAFAQSQQSTPPAPSIADAARAARAQKSTAPGKIFTNDDLAPSPAAPAETEESAAQAAPITPGKAAAAAASASESTGCNNPNNEQIQAELQAAQDELDQLNRDLAYDPKVISNGDVDLKNFKPGSSGLAFGSPPLSQSQPQSPGRIQQVTLEERIAALKQASAVACAPPKDAKIQEKLDAAQNQLKWLQRQFDLDQNVFYSKTNYAQDAAGKAKLDDEQQQIESLQAEIDSLKAELPPPQAEQPTE